MTTHDWMFCVHLVQWAPLILHPSPKEIGRQLILQIFDALFICVAKEKPDHPVIEDSVNKSINDHSQLRLASELLKKSLVHGGCIQDFVECFAGKEYCTPKMTTSFRVGAGRLRTFCSDPMEAPTRDQVSHR